MATLLLVLNDLSEATAFPVTLSEMGHKVLVEADGRSALAALERQWVDLVVCDAVVPGLVATDLITAARTNLGRPQFPAIVISSLPRTLLNGVAPKDRLTVLAAPVMPDQLAQQIARLRLIEPGRERRAARVPSAGLSRRWDDPPKSKEP